MAIDGQGALVGWYDCDARRVVEMNEWMAREHIPERLVLPGFLRARRFRSRGTRPEFFVIYELEVVDALSSDAYLQVLNNPTRLTREIAPSLVGTRRTACRLTATAGDTDGGTFATLDIEPSSAGADALRAHLSTRVIPELVMRPGVFSAHLLEPNYEISTIQTVEKTLRTTPDVMANWVVAVEGLSEDAILSAAGELLAEDELTAGGAAAVEGLHVFELAFAASARAAGA